MNIPFFQSSEQKAIGRILQGDREALGQVYEAQFDAVYSFVYYRVGCNQPVAEDITQIVFVTMMDKLARYDAGKGTLCGWLCGIARHRIGDWMRSQARQSPVGLVQMTLDGEIESILEAIDQAPLADEQVQREELKACVAGTIARLPEHYRTVLLKKYYEDEDVRSIARTMGVSEKTVESRLTRAREAFRKIFTVMVKDMALISG